MENDGTSLEEARQVQFFGDILAARGVTRPGAVGVPYTAGLPGPEFWADAPWRLEPPGPGQDAARQEIPFCFIVRDLEGSLDTIRLYALPDEAEPVWETAGPGLVKDRFWVHRTAIRRDAFTASGPHQRFKVVFFGRWRTPFGARSVWEQYLSIHLAAEPLPLRDTSQWYYGDTHYHSDYTNDIKEFGGPVADTRSAAECIGLDWVVLTDHSCDLDDRNPYFEGHGADGRWEVLEKEVAEANALGQVRILRGEEVTVQGKQGLPGGSNTLHMLVFGSGLRKRIPGAWARKSLLSLIAANLPPGTKDLYEYLFGTIYDLGEILTGKDHAGKVVPALDGRSVQAQNVLAFAAHPTTMAQGAGGTWEDEDLCQEIHGMEAWNSRAWFQADPEQCPFDTWQATSRKEREKCLRGVERWDEMLRWRVAHADDPRFVLLAGSDAHGSFNYGVGLGKDWDGVRADDNCLGRVRTALYLPYADPERRMLTEEQVEEAIRTASCVVTDGPVLNFTVAFNGDDPATLGQIVPVAGDGTLDVALEGYSTDEFGEVKDVDIVYWFEGMGAPQSTRVKIGEAPGGPLARYLAEALRYVRAVPWEVDVPSGSGYVRLQTETEATTAHGTQTYRCFTNPIWIHAQDAGHRRLRVTCAGR